MDRQVSNSVSELDLDKLGPILQGRLTDLPPISSRLVRIFISSTFSGKTGESLGMEWKWRHIDVSRGDLLLSLDSYI